MPGLGEENTGVRGGRAGRGPGLRAIPPRSARSQCSHSHESDEQTGRPYGKRSGPSRAPAASPEPRFPVGEDQPAPHTPETQRPVTEGDRHLRTTCLTCPVPFPSRPHGQAWATVSARGEPRGAAPNQQLLSNQSRPSAHARGLSRCASPPKHGDKVTQERAPAFPLGQPLPQTVCWAC